MLSLFLLQVKLKDMGTINKKSQRTYSIAEEEGLLDLLPHFFVLSSLFFLPSGISLLPSKHGQPYRSIPTAPPSDVTHPNVV